LASRSNAEAAANDTAPVAARITMNIVFLNGNGGAGQTTLSVLFALALHDAGHRPVVRKLDPRVTASRFLVSP
jgi:cellulose biosynthesis protein BcsQ